jgi:rhamnogalacturonyl hydrolase YesR
MFKDISPINSNRATPRVSLLKVFCAVFLAAGLVASARASGPLTGSSGNGWHAETISPAATGTFTATYDAAPSVSPENAVIGLSNGAATGFGNLGCIARFNPTGQIDAYNGTGYAAASSINYSAGVWYHFRFVVNVTAHTYSVYVTPTGGTELTVGLNYAFRSTANTMTSLTDWNLDVDPSIGGASLTAINFAISSGSGGSFTITSLAGSGGSISPSGTLTANPGSSQTYTITAASGSMVSNVIIDGVSQGVLNSYTFSNIQSNDNITVAFQPLTPTFTITASAGSGGIINGTNATGTMLPLSGPVTVIQGATQSFTIVPGAGFAVASVTVDGANIGAVTSYKFSDVLANHTISATFQTVPTFTITPSAGANGTINPLVPTLVEQGSNQSVTIAANSGFTVSNVIVDGASVGAVGLYTFSNVQANHTISATFTASAANSYLTSAYILQAIRTVTDYAVENPSADSTGTKALPDTWVRATLADALVQTYVDTGDTHYLNSANVWAEGNRSPAYFLNGVLTPTPPVVAGGSGNDVWQVATRAALPTSDAHWWIPGTNTYMDVQYHADDSCCGHAYQELYDLDPRPVTNRYKIAELASIQSRIDHVISNPDNLSGRKIWWWADALFMAPPNFALLAKITGEPQYATALDSMYWDTYAYLFSPADNLFFRDDKYFPGQILGSTAHGERVIWSRAQGWTMAGLVEILTYLPTTDPQYANYVTLFKNMAAAAKARQQPSGLWHTSLNDQADGYPGAGFAVGQVDGDETSGSAFLVYALAWGIDNGLLPTGTNGYDSVVKNGWVALQGKIQPNGSLGYSEIVGQTPAAVNPSDTTDFGTGAFALAGLKVNALYGTH